MTSGLRRPRRRLDAVRRPQILATATDLVREKGLWSVRISDVAKRAEMSPTSVVYYFGTKDELFADAISRADDMFYEPVLDERKRWVAAVSHGRPEIRITMTYPAIERSRHVAFLVAGKEKAEILAAIRKGGSEVPAA